MAIIKPSAVLVKEFMTTNVVSVGPDVPLVEAAKIFSQRDFDGLPVVGKDNKLVGIITEYDMLSKSIPVHLPTFQYILQSLPVFQKDKSHFSEDLNPLFELKVVDVMNKDPLTLNEDATYEEAVEIFKNHHRVNPVPVVDENGRVVGVISRFDILKPLYALQ